MLNEVDLAASLYGVVTYSLVTVHQHHYPGDTVICFLQQSMPLLYTIIAAIHYHVNKNSSREYYYYINVNKCTIRTTEGTHTR